MVSVSAAVLQFAVHLFGKARAEGSGPVARYIKFGLQVFDHIVGFFLTGLILRQYFIPFFERLSGFFDHLIVCLRSNTLFSCDGSVLVFKINEIPDKRIFAGIERRRI